MTNTISFNTKFGWISACEIHNKITRIYFKKQKNKGFKSQILKELREKINAFFNQKITKIVVPINMSGNKVQKKVWRELVKIKKGRTKTYQEIGKKIKISPRYVGKICSQNKHLIVIPCHRIIRSNGTLGGFSANGGIGLKKKLLNFERLTFNEC